MVNDDNFILISIMSSMFILLIIRDVIKATLKANIGKKNEKKVNPKPSIGSKILLTYTIKYTKKYSRLCKIFVSLNCVYIFIVSLLILLIILSNFNIIFAQAAIIVLKVKGIIVDIPVVIFFMVCTKSRSQGSSWKFIK